MNLKVLRGACLSRVEVIVWSNRLRYWSAEEEA